MIRLLLPVLTACIVSWSKRLRFRLNDTLLTIVAIAGIASWWYTAPDPARLHTWDFFHYYIGAKYFPELRYDGIYECSLAAIEERSPEALEEVTHIRDLTSNELLSPATALERAHGCRSRFDPTRWNAFADDVLWFKDALGNKWSGILRDHGFNPSPVWIAVAENLIPDSPVSYAVLHRLATIDTVLIVALWSLIFCAYPRASLAIAAVFWGTNALATFDWTGNSFLRHDWLFASVAAVVALRRGWVGTAGAFLSYATGVRIFPGLIALGVTVAAFRRPTLARDAKRFLFGFVFMGIFLAGVSVASLGSAAWTQFAQNLSKHVDTRAGNLVGFPQVVDHVVQCQYAGFGAANGTCAPPERASESPYGRAKSVAAGLSSLLFLLWIRRASRAFTLEECAIVSLGLLPLAMGAASYYYEMFLVFGLLSRHVRVGVALLLVSTTLYLVSAAVSPPNKVYLVASVLVAQFVAVLPILISRVTGDTR